MTILSDSVMPVDEVTLGCGQAMCIEDCPVPKRFVYIVPSRSGIIVDMKCYLDCKVNSKVAFSDQRYVSEERALEQWFEFPKSSNQGNPSSGGIGINHF